MKNFAKNKHCQIWWCAYNYEIFHFISPLPRKVLEYVAISSSQYMHVLTLEIGILYHTQVPKIK